MTTRTVTELRALQATAFRNWMHTLYGLELAHKTLAQARRIEAAMHAAAGEIKRELRTAEREERKRRTRQK